MLRMHVAAAQPRRQGLHPTATRTVRFVMTDGGASMPVNYHGIIPDTFVDGADVVVEGQIDGSGTFQAHTLLAKCPSKYEAADDADASTSAAVSTQQL